MKKKIIAVATAAVCLFALASCGDNEKVSSEGTTTTAPTTTTPLTTTTNVSVTTTSTTITEEAGNTTTAKPATTTVTTTATKKPTTTTTPKVTTTVKPSTTPKVTTTVKPTTTKITTTTAKKPTTTTTTPDSIDVPEKEVMLDVECILGYTDLTSGSGITAAAIVLKYYGINVEVLKLKQYAEIYGLNTIEDGVTPSPWDVIVGEPLTPTAKYYAKPIVNMVNNYVDKNGLSEIKAEDISGATMDELINYIDKGKPVIVWGTETGEKAEDGISWILPSGEKFTSKAKVKVYVVVGYTESEILIMNDVEMIYPLPKDEFVPMYESVYSQAILIE